MTDIQYNWLSNELALEKQCMNRLKLKQGIYLILFVFSLLIFISTTTIWLTGSSWHLEFIAAIQIFQFVMISVTYNAFLHSKSKCQNLCSRIKRMEKGLKKEDGPLTNLPTKILT